MAENTSTNKERLKEITDGIEQNIKDLFQSDRYAEYLKTMSRFHKYSVNNQILIFTQRPDATLVAGFGKWRDQFGRYVKKGEKGIKIIAPTPYKKKIEMEKLDPDTQRPILNPDGSVVTEEKEIRIPMYKPAAVFDAAQTVGKPLPTLVADLTGNVERYDFFSEALLRASPVPITFEDISGKDGYFSVTDQRIVINDNMSEIQTVCAIIHEICHSKIHNYEKQRLAAAAGDESAEVQPKDRRTEEVESESVALAVSAYYHIDTSENSIPYIAAWSSDKELPELRASLETINKTASGLITDIDNHYRAVVKEYDFVIEQFAADCDTYVRENPANSLLLANREESIEQIVDEIKAGNGIYVRTDIIVAAQNEGAASPDDLLRRLDEIEKNYPERETEALYLLDNSVYLHLDESDDGYNYSLYDRDSLREIDGGYIDAADISLDDAYTAVLEMQEMYPESSEEVSLDILDDIRAVHQQDIEDYKREHNIGQLDIDVDSEAERAIAEHEAEFGADGRRALGGGRDEIDLMQEAVKNNRTYDLIATYEELFVENPEDRIVKWFGDAGIHVPKDGVTEGEIYQVYRSGLSALHNSHDIFLNSDRYAYRGNIVVDMCQQNDLPIPEYILNQLPPEERAKFDPAQMSEVERWETDHIADFTVTEQSVQPPYPMPNPDLSNKNVFVSNVETESVYLLDSETYLYIDESDAGYIYNMYDKSLRETDGGYIDTPDLSFADAYDTILANHGLTPETSEKVSLDILDEIAAVRQQDIEDYLREGQYTRWVNQDIDQPEVGQTAPAPAKDYDIPEEDRFFEKDDGSILWMYYNPDSSAGGQFVFNQITTEDILASAAEHPNATFFFESLEDACRQTLIDVDDTGFEDALQAFEQPSFLEESFTGGTYSQDARDSLVAKARELEALHQKAIESPMPLPEQAYTYPMPDPDLSVEDLERSGYMDGDMLPLSKERALELMEQDITVYMLYDDNSEAMAFDADEIRYHDGIFGVERQDWEQTEEYKDAVEKQDSFELYQVKQGEQYRDFLFERYDRLESAGLSVDRDNYDLVYSAPLTGNSTTDQKLESIYQQFNMNHPADFRGHSLSVSDIVALKLSGNVSYHYCDSFGFQELPGFNSGKNPMRSVEDSIEQNDNNLDGIINNVQTPTVAELESQAKSGQPISLMDLARAVKEESRDKQEKRPSVLEKLRQPLPQNEKAIDKKTAPKKSAEMER